MGITYDENSKTYRVSHHKRHPITRMPISRRREGIKTEAEAKRALKQLVIEVEDILRKRTVPSWQKLVEDYLTWAKTTDLTQKTVRDYELGLRAYTLEPWSERTIDSISPHDIRELITTRMQGKAQSHQKNLLKFIRAVFAYALDQDLVLRNPAPQMKFKTGDKIKRVLTEEQARILLTKAKEVNWEWYPHYSMALYTGMRNGELYALTWDKVNLDSRQILVDCSWNLT